MATPMKSWKELIEVLIANRKWMMNPGTREIGERQKSSPDQLRQRRAEREIRGRGEREEYKPYIKIGRGELSSRGVSTVFPSIYFNRLHHLLSSLEKHVLWMLFLLYPYDIQEQFPLELVNSTSDRFHTSTPFAMGTLEIAEAIGVKHPKFSWIEPIRMTTDFVVTLQSGEKAAFHVKYESELAKPRNAELRAIEEAYWHERNVRFYVITEKDIDKQKIANLSMLLSFRKELLVKVSKNWLQDLVELAQDEKISNVAKMLAILHGQNEENQKHTIKYVIATGRVHLDLAKRQLSWHEVWPPMSIKSEKDMQGDAAC